MDDWSLIREYVEKDSESAFERLVRSNIDMVYGAALRQVHDPNLAQDVTQAVFILLSRKAARLSSGFVIAGWLYRTACFVGQRALRDQLRRQLKEKEMAEMFTNDPSEPLWQAVAPHLDAALADLGESERNAIVLRYLQQRSFREVGSTLKITEDAAKKRVSRALEKLRKILERRGVIAATTALGVALGTTNIHAAPSGLIALSIQGGLTAGATAGPAVLQLVGNALRDALITKLKWTTGVIVIGTLLLVGLSQFGTGPTIRTTKTASSAGGGPVIRRAPKTAATAKVEVPPENPGTMVVHVFAEETGLPLSGAELRATFYGRKDERINWITDDAGIARVNRPSNPFEGMLFRVVAPGRIPILVYWKQEEELSLPAEYTVRLAKGRRIAGTVIDENRRPVAGASLHFLGQGMQWNSRESVDYRTPLTTPETDSFGHWSADFISPHARWLSGRIKHPDFAESNFDKVDSESETKIVFVVRRGGVIAGNIYDEEGRPVENASVKWSDILGWRDDRAARTDATGHFEFKAVAEGQCQLAIAAEGFRSTNRFLELANAGTNIDFALHSTPLLGNSILLGRVIDDKGQPIRNVEITFVPTSNSSNVDWKTTTDENGKFEWQHAPDRNVYLSLTGWDWQKQNAELRPDGTEHVIVLRPLPAFILRGIVHDKATAQPIPSFKVVTGHAPVQKGFPFNPEAMLGEGHDGKFAFRLKSGRLPTGDREIVLLFQAPGYGDTSVPLAKLTNDVYLEIEMEASVEVSGAVWLPTGLQAVGAEVSFRRKNLGVDMLAPGKFRDSNLPHQIKAVTGEDGKFRIAKLDGAERLAVIHPAGWANVPLSTLPDTAIWLQPWGKIRGVVQIGGRSWPGIVVTALSGNASSDQVSFDLRTKTDDQGRFEFPAIPGYQAQIALVQNSGWNSGLEYAQRVKVKPGEITAVRIGGSGARIMGRIVSRPETANINWEKSYHLLGHKGSVATEFRSDYGFFCREDGSFIVEDVSPGEYQLMINLLGRDKHVESGGPVLPDSLGSTTRNVIIPEALAESGEIDLGTIEVTVYNNRR
jgi:RNA polymerase sigma factor (sigma-70 family)